MLNVDKNVVSKIRAIITGLGFNSNSSVGSIDGFIKDLALLRHKLVHFNYKYKVRHFNPSLYPNLKRLNVILLEATLFAIRNISTIEKR